MSPLTRNVQVTEPLAQHTMHRTFDSRLRTFEGQAQMFPVPIEDIAAAGFCWTPFRSSPMMVRCEECGVLYQEWRAGIDPVAAHAIFMPNCPFVLRNRTSLLIDVSEDKTNAPPSHDSVDFAARHGLVDLIFNTAGHIAARETRLAAKQEAQKEVKTEVQQEQLGEGKRVKEMGTQTDEVTFK